MLNKKPKFWFKMTKGCSQYNPSYRLYSFSPLNQKLRLYWLGFGVILNHKVCRLLWPHKVLGLGTFAESQKSGPISICHLQGPESRRWLALPLASLSLAQNIFTRGSDLVFFAEENIMITWRHDGKWAKAANEL